MNRINLGERLKRMREFRNLTQAQLAAMLNFHRSRISRYEKGRHPSMHVLQEIAEALQCSFSALLGEHPHGFDPRRCALELRSVWGKLDGGAQYA
ncbi:MAG: helix-turn-helix transcriptional regulator [Flavobacteriales bacterium]|nr:helix-turn-helix transcriptional regulator [Flavobacteriales bacterium]